MTPLDYSNIFSPSVRAYPLISIGIPTYNGGNRIMKALQSVWDQKYPHVEIIISDNHSNDNTEALCRGLAQENPTIKYYRQPQNIGLVGNFEYVLSKASGKYFMWVADDDALEPGVLIKYVNFLDAHSEYSLVSGAIQYWNSNRRAHVEKGFTFEQENPSVRCVRFYFKVVYGGMFHGMMRRSIGTSIPSRRVFGNDYHFVANLAFCGKVKNFDFIGYHKWLGGTSRDNRKYAKAIGESTFTGYFPHVKMSYDAFAEVMFRSPVFRRLTAFERTLTATSCAAGILCCYGFTILPFTIGGKIRRALTNAHKGLDARSKNMNGSLQQTHMVSSNKNKSAL